MSIDVDFFRYGEDVVPRDKPIPAHLLGDMWAQVLLAVPSYCFVKNFLEKSNVYAEGLDSRWLVPLPGVVRDHARGDGDGGNVCARLHPQGHVPEGGRLLPVPRVPSPAQTILGRQHHGAAGRRTLPQLPCGRIRLLQWRGLPDTAVCSSTQGHNHRHTGTQCSCVSSSLFNL